MSARDIAEAKFGGATYKKGGSDKSGIDCSHMVHEAVKATGTRMPYLSTHDYAREAPKYGFSVTTSPQRGDVVLWDGHMGLYSGGGMCYSATSHGVRDTKCSVFKGEPAYYHKDK